MSSVIETGYCRSAKRWRYRVELTDAEHAAIVSMLGRGIKVAVADLLAQSIRDELADLDIRRCRVCGCTDENCSQCIKKTGEPCHWVAPDLCSACVDEV